LITVVHKYPNCDTFSEDLIASVNYDSALHLMARHNHNSPALHIFDLLWAARNKMFHLHMFFTQSALNDSCLLKFYFPVWLTDLV